MFLLDTNVVSELRKSKPHGAVLAWFQQAPESGLYLSAVTIGEIQKGIEITRTIDPAKAQEIQDWLDGLVGNFPILPADAAIFRRWALLLHGHSDHHLEDALIAATALAHGLTVVTRNVRDFKPFRVAVFDPFRFGR
ncbi:MAG: type II toxin-antitoxin system VapC family toxin [Proteobacteria bacterium]|nr:type II toxin-antitoxin system VapC family toxin [Pseudomonadota bacterium]MBS0462378.1 type II toxin-antitoxin system VapC family toxin [Pseudomonadota bacterium]MBS0463668.1 type II toxin-antitoxin system VapC family toxin [Pseudomonadota bacterium]